MRKDTAKYYSEDTTIIYNGQKWKVELTRIENGKRVYYLEPLRGTDMTMVYNKQIEDGLVQRFTNRIMKV